VALAVVTWEIIVIRIRKHRVLAAFGVIAALGGIVGVTATAVGAAGPPATDVTNDSIQCDQITGKITFAPPLQDGGTAAATAQVKLKVSDCTDDAVPSGVVSGATVIGSLTLANNDCANLFSGLQSWAGSLTANWRPAAGVKLTTKQSTIALSQVNGAVFGSGVPTGDNTTWTGEYGLVQFGTDANQGATAAPSVTGDFTGGNGGSGSTFDLATNETNNNLQTACGSTSGLKQLTAGIGSLSLD
jgi:hypothetical protein